MISKVGLVGLIVMLLFVFSTFLPIPTLSCETSMKRKEASLVCLLPEKNNGEVKPVMALVTKDGEFYPLMDSEGLTHKLDNKQKKIYESRYR
ncbi:MAG: hypothetical protein ACREOW_03095 [Thermodesulfobacteriota bacterium]